MERLKYIVEDSTLAELLGVQNFTSEESAVLELVKNAYDAHAKKVTISFANNILSICDDGIGMDRDTIHENWMHVGRSSKGYSTIDDNGKEERVLAGSKGIGRFALARLGAHVTVYSTRKHATPVKWETDWIESTLDDWSNASVMSSGTRIEISMLRDKWSERKIAKLTEYLSVAYNDNKMIIEINPNNGQSVSYYFSNPQLGVNCVSKISIHYESEAKRLHCIIDSDEFKLEAKTYCPDVNLHHYEVDIDVPNELVGDNEIDLQADELNTMLGTLGDFTSELYFSFKSSTQKEVENFLYKYDSLSSRYEKGVVLYRNAFSISSFDGQKDWLGFGKRSRKSPAAASHPNGAWRVRENQISGKVNIDRQENINLKDLSNRQGLEENIYFELLTKIITAGIAAFERYRQSIIRLINEKNKQTQVADTKLVDEILKDPAKAKNLSESDTQTLVQEIAIIKKESKSYREEKILTEERYRYDVRILNVLATSGLKAASIAHELKNDRNSVSVNYNYIVSALKEYNFWDELNSPECTEHSYKNVPQLLGRNKNVSEKILVFMDTMLDEMEKQKFSSKKLSVTKTIEVVKANWERDYACLEIALDIDEELYFETAEDVFSVILDNLILNSLQQNENSSKIDIFISVKKSCNRLNIYYCDNGIGLSQKYINDPMRILAVHETSRKNGHGLGMWIVNNTVLMTGGVISKIDGHGGFKIYFELGDRL